MRVNGRGAVEGSVVTGGQHSRQCSGQAVNVGVNKGDNTRETANAATPKTTAAVDAR